MYVPKKKKKKKNPRISETKPMCSRVSYVEKKKKPIYQSSKTRSEKVSLLIYVVLMVRKADNAGECADQNKIGSKTEGSHLGKKKQHLFL